MWAYVGLATAASFAAGVAVGLLMLVTDQFVVSRLARPRAEQPPGKWPFLALHIGKYALAAVVMWLVARQSLSSIAAAVGGYGLPIAVIVLKVAGERLNRRLGIGPPDA